MPGQDGFLFHNDQASAQPDHNWRSAIQTADRGGAIWDGAGCGLSFDDRHESK